MSASMSPTESSLLQWLLPRALPRDDRILLFTRVAGALVLVALALGFVLLFVWPHETEQRFAWTIQAQLTSMLIGAGYLAGAYFFARVITERKWHRVARGFLPIGLFTAFELLATVLHWDRFHQGHPAFYTWLVIYVTTPFLVPLIWYRNRVTDPGTPEANDLQVPARLRLFGALFAIAALAGIVFWFIFPQRLIEFFPWSLTPLTARVTCGWFALGAATLLSLTRDARWSAWQISMQSGSVGLAFMLIGLARGSTDLNFSNPYVWLMVAVLVGFLLFFALVLIATALYRRNTRSTARAP